MNRTISSLVVALALSVVAVAQRVTLVCVQTSNSSVHVVLDERAGTASYAGEDDRPASFTATQVSWDSYREVAGDKYHTHLELNRDTGHLAANFYSNGNHGAAAYECNVAKPKF